MADPTTIANLRGWWKADNIIAPPANGGKLQNWTDSSGAGATATQATLAKRPVYRTTGTFLPNGKPVLEFTASAATSMTATRDNKGATTRFFVFRMKTAGVTQVLTTASAGFELFLNSGNYLLLDVPNVASLNISPAAQPSSTTAWYVATFDSNGSNSHRCYLGGAAAGTSTSSGTATATTLDIGARAWNAGQYPLNAYVAEIVDYSAVLSTADRAGVHSYLSDKYAITVADYVAAGVTTTKAPADTVGLTDDALFVWTRIRTADEVVGITDIVPLPGYSGGYSAGYEPAAAQASINPADSVWITDTVATDRGLTTSDPVSVADAASAVSGRDRSVADTVGLTDTATLVWARERTPADQVAVTDSATKGQTTTNNPADSIGVTDTVTATSDVDRTADDPVGLADVAAGAYDRPKSADDSVGVTDSLLTEQATTTNPADQVTITDQVSTIADLTRTIADQVAVTDAVGSVFDRPAASDDPVGISDAAAFVWARLRVTDDPVGLTDSSTANRSGTGTVSPADLVNVTDTAATTADRDRTNTDPVGLSDTAVFTWDRSRTAADQILVTDQATTEAAASQTQTPNDSVGITDLVSTQRGAVSDPDDQISIPDAADILRDVDRTAADLVTITDEAIFAWILELGPSRDITVTGSLLPRPVSGSLPPRPGVGLLPSRTALGLLPPRRYAATTTHRRWTGGLP